MSDYDYVEVDVTKLDIDELTELIGDAVEDSLDTCRWSENGARIILKYVGTEPPAFTKYQTALSTAQKNKDFRRDVVDNPVKKFSHEKKHSEIVLKVKKSK